MDRGREFAELDLPMGPAADLADDEVARAAEELKRAIWRGCDALKAHDDRAPELARHLYLRGDAWEILSEWNGRARNLETPEERSAAMVRAEVHGLPVYRADWLAVPVWPSRLGPSDMALVEEALVWGAATAESMEAARKAAR